MFKLSKIVLLNLIIILGTIQMLPTHLSQRQPTVSILIQLNM